MRKILLLSCVLLGIGLVTSVFGQNVPELLYYQFDGSGTTVPNLASSPPTGSNNATIVGGLTQGSTGLCGGALIGNGGTSSSNYVSTGWNTTLGNSAWTIMFWTNNIPTGTTLYYQFGDAGASSFRCFNNGVAGAGNWMLRGPITDVLCTGCAPVGNNPTMAAFVYDPVAGNIKSYKDGVLNTTVSQSTLNINGSGFRIAGGGGTGMGSGQLMDEFRFYNRAVDASEVLLVYNQCLPLVSAPNDAAVTAINEPTNFCADTLDVKATVKNAGTSQLASCMVNWSVNGAAQTALSFGGTLDTLNGSGPQDTLLTLGSYVFAAGVPYTIKVWTSMPNGVADTVNYNDTMTVTVQAAISGNYIIGGPTQDYANFSAAISDLVANGVCGPVIFDVYDSNFVEQITIDEIPGASSTNTILFRPMSGNPLVSFYNLSSTTNYILDLNGADYVTFDNIDFRNDGPTYGRAIYIHGGSEYNTFMNCDIVGDTTPTTTSTNMAVIYSNTDQDNGNMFLNNTIRGGSYGFYYWGSGTTALESGTVIEGNHISGIYYQGIYNYYQDANKIRNNVIDFSASNYTGSQYRINCNYCDNKVEITGNKAKGGGYGYGIYLSNCDGTSSDNGYVNNNMLYVGNPVTTSTSYGIYLTNTGYFNIDHNSVWMNSNGTSSRALYGTGGGANTVFNNNFFTTGPGYAVYLASAFTFSNMDFNNLRAPSGKTGYISGDQATLADWQVASNFDNGSISVDPVYKSMDDLHVCSDSVDGMGDPLMWVTTDIDGQMRDITIPDIGADEFTPLGQGFLGPDLSFCIGDSALLVGGSGADTTIWSTGDTANFLWINAAGTYWATVTSVCGTGTDTLFVGQAADVYTGFLEADTNKACDGDTITLSSNTSYPNYSWSSGGTGMTEKVTASGTYTLDVNDNCGTGQESVTVTFVPSPLAGFSSTSSFLTGIFTNSSTTAGMTTYAWDFGDGSGTSNLQDPIYIYGNQGTYLVTLTVSNECGSDTYSDSITIIVVGQENELNSKVNVYPNPSSGKFFIDFNFDQRIETSLSVLSLQGQVLYQADLGMVSGNLKHEVITEDLANGFYMLRIDAGESHIVRRLIIE